MRIRRLRVKNFKSFKEIDIELENLNVLIGANASGKSNFLEILEFLKDISSIGLVNAIEKHGGAKYIKNFNANQEEEIEIGIELETETNDNAIEILEKTETGPSAIIYEYQVSFSINPTNGKSNVSIIMEKVLERGEKTYGIKVQKGELQFFEQNWLYKFFYKRIIEERVKQKPGDVTLLELGLYGLTDDLKKFFSNIAIYEIQPFWSRRPVESGSSGISELSRTGDNLPIILKKILSREKDARAFHRILTSLLPHIQEIQVENFESKYFMLNIEERFFKGRNIPAFLTSDGTISIIALVLATFFSNAKIIGLEEPMKNVHPALIPKVINLLKDASNQKQIFFTTHNPETLRHLELRNILAIKRDRDGNSHAERLSDREDLKIFLQNEIGLDELFVENLLT